MNEIANILTQNEKFKDIVKEIKLNTTPISILGLVDVAKIQFASALLEQTNKKICIITYNDIQAKNLLKNLNYFNKKVVYFPKKEIELKNRIKTNSFDILELSYETNSIEDVKTKIQLLQKVLAKIKVIDFLLNLSLDKEMITSKKYLKLANKIDDITKYTVGWVNSMTGSKNHI